MIYIYLLNGGQIGLTISSIREEALVWTALFGCFAVLDELVDVTYTERLQ